MLLLLLPSGFGLLLGSSLRFRCLLRPLLIGAFLVGAKIVGVRNESLLDAGKGFGRRASPVAEAEHTDGVLPCSRRG
jgi:hypothetical protein